MHKLILWIQVLPTPTPSFGNIPQQLLQEQFPEAIKFDLDNFSEAQLVTHVLQLLQEAEEGILLIDATTNSPMGALLRLLNSQQLKKMKAILIGEHTAISKMLRMNCHSFTQLSDIVDLEKLLTTESW